MSDLSTSAQTTTQGVISSQTFGDARALGSQINVVALMAQVMSDRSSEYENQLLTYKNELQGVVNQQKSLSNIESALDTATSNETSVGGVDLSKITCTVYDASGNAESVSALAWLQKNLSSSDLTTLLSSTSASGNPGGANSATFSSTNNVVTFQEALKNIINNDNYQSQDMQTTISGILGEYNNNFSAWTQLLSDNKNVGQTITRNL